METNKIRFNLNKWHGLSLRVIALFFIAMLVSFTPEYFRDFFGDKLLQPDKYGYYTHSLFDETYRWGVRHYFYFWMCVCAYS